VPSTAVSTSEEQSTVIVVRDGQQVSTVVETGLEGDRSTEIVSGLSEGDEVLLSATASSGSSGSSGFPGGGFPGVGAPGGGGP
jgi:macrolide-specific efflux system membrane fusion protein